MHDFIPENRHAAEHADAALPPYPSAVFSHKSVMLASASPRRRELLGLIVPEFTIAQSRDVDETYPPTLPAHQVPAYLSRLKADAYADILNPDSLLITADTVVISEGRILGKPKDAADAFRMLKSLAGRKHTVVTGVTLSAPDGKQHDTFTESTDVTFAPLTDAEIEEYVARFRPFDKAGAYGIQEWIGAAAIRGIDGCFYNVMGLPLHALYTHLKNFFS